MFVDVSTLLACSPSDVRRYVQTPRLLEYVARPLVHFEPRRPNRFPETWEPGTFWVAMRLFGLLPIGEQAVVISSFERGENFCLRDNGYSDLIRKWDHVITVAPHGDGTLYRDRVEIDAGLLTPAIWLFAQVFYRHRQRRWRRFVAHGFRYD